MTQRFEGHNLEEALDQAAEALGVERHRVIHRVLIEKRGFLGGVKRVVIEAEVDTNQVQVVEPPPRSAEPPVAPAAARPARPERADRAERGGRRDRAPRGGEREGRGGRGSRGRRNEQAPSRTVWAERLETPAPEQAPESEAATAVHKWCEELLGHARLNAQVRTEENETQIIVRLYGSDSERLTEHNGELLDAVQVLANKALVGRNVEKDIELDCSQFKERRVEELGERARTIAERVKRDRREQLLPAMTPIERRIVHLALQDDPEVTTESRGEGFYKRVAVMLRPETDAQPEP